MPTIRLTEAPSQRVALVRGHTRAEDLGTFLSEAYAELRALLDGQRVSPSGPPFVRYGTGDAGLDVEAGLPVDRDVRPGGRVTVEELPGGPVVSAVHDGDYGTVGFTYEAILEWLAGNDYVQVGAAWESYPDGAVAPGPGTTVSMPCRRLPDTPAFRVHV